MTPILTLMKYCGVLCIIAAIIGLTVILIQRATRTKPKAEQNPHASPKKGWEYNERARMWVNAAQMDEEKSRLAYEANRQKWDEFRKHEAETEEMIILSKQIRNIRNEPTFEEWKEKREKSRNDTY